MVDAERVSLDLRLLSDSLELEIRSFAECADSVRVLLHCRMMRYQHGLCICTKNEKSR